MFAAPVSDELEHYRLASRIAAGDWFGRNEGLMMRPPLFAWVCAVAFKIFSASFLVTHAIILLSDLASVGLWYLVATRCFSLKTAAIAGFFVAAYWPFIHFSSTGYMESFALALNAAMVLALCVYFRRVGSRAGNSLSTKSIVMLILAGLLAGLGALARPTLLIVMPFLGILVMVPFLRRERANWGGAIVAAAILTIATVAAMSPNAIRHLVLFNKWVPLGVNGELNFNMGNNDEGWGWQMSPGIEYNIYRDTPAAIGNRPVTIEASREYWAEQNRDFVANHPADFLKGVAVKFLQTLNQYEIHVINDFREHLRLSPVERYALPSSLIIPLGFAGLVWCLFGMRRFSGPGFHRNSGVTYCRAMLCGWVLLYMLGVALYHANTRHRLPALPPLVLLAGFAVTEGVRVWKIRRRSPRRLFVWVVLVVLGVVLTRLPVIPAWMPRHEDWWTHVNKAVALNQLDRTPEAVVELHKATETMPEKLESWRLLALAEERLGNYGAAAQAQQVLVDLIVDQYPQYTAMRAEQLETLVRFQVKAGELTAAEEHAKKLISLAPNHFRPYAAAADVARALGNTTATLQFTSISEQLRSGKP